MSKTTFTWGRKVN